jgi:serine/threonine-protein kinase
LPDLLTRLQALLAERYRLEHELGRGGMAIVYLAEDLRHQRRVALKVLKPELARAIGPGRFLQEIEIAARLNHPHILPLHDSGEADGLLYYVMPYVEGESLRDRLTREKQLPMKDAIQIVLHVADGLGYAHRLGVIHRDIKPENILLAADHAVLSDFGIARAVSEAGGEHLTETGLALGTPAYMSPEQASGVKDLDARTDIYSLGCVLYEMLAGQPPFTGPSPMAILARKSVEPVPALWIVRETVPQAVESVIMQALAKVPADRFATAHEFAEALDIASAGGPAGRRPVVLTSRRRTRIVAGLAAALLVASVAASRVLLRQETGLVPNRVVVGIFENRTGDPSLNPLGAIATDRLTDGIQLTGVVEVVPTTATLFVASALPVKNGSADAPLSDLRLLAEETGAGTVVSGAFYRLGDSLQFQARVVDARRRKLIGAIDPVAGPVERPLEAIEMLRQRVLGTLAAHFDATIHAGGLVASPPTFATYKEYLEGLKLFSQLRIAEAIPHLDSAVALDSTFVPALFLNANAQASVGQFATFDSVVELLAGLRGRMSSAQGHYLDWMQANRRGDLTGALRALRQMAALTPDPGSRYMVGVFGLRANRPGEALRGLTKRDRQSLFWRTWSWTWQVPTEAYHLLGNHQQELKEARRGREQHPDLLVTMHYEVLALAALGRLNAVQSLLDQALSLPPQPLWTYGSLAANAGLEFRAHGYPEAARDLNQRAIEWYKKRLSENPGQADRRYELARCLYWAERWSGARSLFAGLLTEVPDSGAPWRGIGTASDFDYLGFLGAVAAREGHRDEARRISQRLGAIARPYLFGHPTLWRAKIAALLGDREEAVGLLREAIGQGLLPLDLAQGLGYTMWLHRDIDFESLRDYMPFQELLRPKA